MRLSTPLALSLLLTLGACAGSDDPSPITQPADMTPDLAPQPDLPPDLPDLAPDLPEDMPADMRCGACCPEDKMCSASGAVAQCKPDGSGFTETACGAEEECMAGACVVKRVCEPGATMCFDARSQLVCRANGAGYSTQECPADASCINGQCLSGELNGVACYNPDDCAGQRCHCGETEQCPAAFTTGDGYCTSGCGAQSACGPTEWCLASSVHAISAMGSNYDHCVPRCMGTCPTPGMECQVLPVYDTNGDVKWEQGCYFVGAKQVGETCTADEECLGGRCLQGYYLNSGVCSVRCEDTACPGDAACVELVPGQLWCSQLCGDGAPGGNAKCPLDVPTDRFDVTCKVRQSTDRGGINVCSKP